MEEIKREKFEELYGKLYESMEEIKNNNGKRRNVEDTGLSYTRFTAMHGNRYWKDENGEENNIRFMLVGRAVNGWGEYLGKNDSKESFVESSMANLTSDKKAFSKNQKDVKDRFEWIVTSENDSPHNTFRENIDKKEERTQRGKYRLTGSPFWSYTKDIWDILNNKKDSSWNERWFEKIAWTNLYKIAPTGYIEENGKRKTWGSNPNTTECNEQIEVCRELLKEEIEYFKPTHILMVIGEDWFTDFRELFTNINDIGRNINSGKNKNTVFLEKTAEYIKRDGNACKVAVVCRPETRPKEEYVNQVSNYFLNE